MGTIARKKGKKTREFENGGNQNIHFSL